ncbi:Serine protease family S33 [Phytophthora palmivora]|uniref:Serine protease family S33 n=1 Tax=Phytophthora palmivora TaxID=4796 RepID=A0A2P4XBF5_9STRA|nr:Serine protease family S33 [Phytophthora palmivora]
MVNGPQVCCSSSVLEAQNKNHPDAGSFIAVPAIADSVVTVYTAPRFNLEQPLVYVFVALPLKLRENFHPKGEVSAYISVILDNLVTYSEMWEAPTPSVSNLKAQFEEIALNAWPSYTQVPHYCVYSKEKSSVCSKLKLGDYAGNGIIYERDEYWNKPATIPSQASVLLMSSKLDPAAPYQYAKSLLNALDGENKELVTFEYTAGGSLVDVGTYEYLCGSLLLASYVQINGNLAKLDKSCIPDEKAALNWTTPITYQYWTLSTDDAYDGEFDASLSEQ